MEPKPSMQTLEGKLTLLVTILTALGSSIGVIMAAYPNDSHVKLVAVVVACFLAALSTFVTMWFTKQRTDLKGAALVAAAIAGGPKLEALGVMASKVLDGTASSAPAAAPDPQ